MNTDNRNADYLCNQYAERGLVFAKSAHANRGTASRRNWLREGQSAIAWANRIIALRTNEAAATPDKRTLYRTARATIACAYFAAGEYVGVRYSHTSDTGVDWYMIDRTQSGAACFVDYPAHHLTDFCL